MRPVPDSLFVCRNHNSRSGILRRIGKRLMLGTAPCADILPCAFLCPHFLPVDRRKSRNNSFSIRSRSFSRLYFASVFAGLRPLLLGPPLPVIQLWIAHLLIPYSLLSLRWLPPVLALSSTSFHILLGYFFIPFFPDIITTPHVALFSYIGGLFVYCPFLLGQYIVGVAF